MQNVSKESLNNNFAEEFLSFKEGPNGFIYADIQNDGGSAQIYLHGAHITSYVPEGQKPVIFLSPHSIYEPGNAIRGGIPISWPWFADHPTDKTKPAHGFARTSEWEVRGTAQLPSGQTQITFGFKDNDETRKLWDYRFDLEINILVGKELGVSLTMTNTDNKEYSITSAFHSYYYVGDISEVAIVGLEGISYRDKVDNFITKKQQGVVKIADETDRIYLDTNNDCLIEDKTLRRGIRIKKNGSNSTVVWNPWWEKAKSMRDLGDGDYNRFVCVETANAGSDVITIAPNEQHNLNMNISVHSLEI